MDLDRDPTPGDPEEIRQLSEELQDFADDVGEALGRIRGMASDRAVQEWAGLSAEAFRAEFDGVPGNLDKLQRSYDMAADALARYWPELQTAQGMADRALQRAIDAQAALSSAQTQLDDAQSWVSRAGDEAERLQDERDQEDAPEPPDETQVRQAVRDHQAAQQAASTAQSRVDNAEADLSAARELARQALDMREEAARTCANGIDEASDAGIHNRRWWERAIDFVVDNWDTIVSVCQAIVAVLGIVVMIIGGPLAWVVLAAALVVLADTLIDYANGRASLWDVAFAALDCIPGMKGLTTLGGLARGLRGGLSAARTGLRGIAQGVRGLGQSLRRMGRGADDLVCRTDPIDMATGEMVMTATDVELPGVLPLILKRHHRTSLREGTWFGPSWASTLDQRLILDDSGLRFVTADGMILDYPRPLADAPVLPVEGPRWPLSWDGQPGTPLTIHQPTTGHTLHFSPVPTRRGAELPLTALTDRNNNTLHITYDETGAPAEITHTGGHHLTITTDTGRITALTLLSDPQQPTLLRYAYDQHGNLTEIYNSSGLPLKLTYDEKARITSWEDRNGTRYHYTYDADGRCTATNGTDGVLASRITYDPHTHRTLFTDSLGNTTVYQFNDSYQLTTETDPLGHHTHRTWDRYDRIQSITDPLGNTTRYTRDEHGHLTSIHRPDGREVSLTCDELGRPTRVVQADGGTWRQEFDAAGNRTALTDPAGAVTRFRYEANGALAELTDALGSVTRIESDPAGLATAVVAATGATTRYRRDAFGRVTEVTSPAGAVTTWEWTPEGRPLRQVDPNGAARSWTWDAEGNCLTHTDRNGGVTFYEYGAFDMATAEIRPDGARYAFTRDTENRLLRVTNAQGLTWDYERDPMGRVVRESDFDGRVVSFSYDEAGRLTSRTNALGQTLSLTRGPLGQITEKTVDGVTTRFSHDALGRLVGAVRDGKGAPDLRLVRDAMGRVVAETVGARTISNAYDAIGRRLSRTTPAGVESAWTYTPFGAPATLATSGRVLAFTYDAEGRETGRRIGDALTLGHSWDPAGQLTGQRLLRGPQALQSRSYDWRPDNYLIGVHDAEAGETRYELDALGRPVVVRSGASEEAYSYDLDGNQTSGRWSGERTDACGERDYAGMRVTRAGRTRYAYDDAGRTVERRVRTLSGKVRTWEYSWDAEDRLTGVVTPGGGRWLYAYDPLGRRVAKRRLAADGREDRRVEFAWDGPVLAEQTVYEAGAAVPVTLTWNHHAHHPLTQVERRGDSGSGLGSGAGSGPRSGPALTDAEVDERFYAIITDLVGTPTHLVSESGETAWRSDLTLWGGGHDQEAQCPLRFPGQYADAETGWHYNLHRHYDPDISRYTSPDPLGLDPAPNAYSYARNPHTWTDPLGLTPCREAARRQALRDAGVPDGAEPLEIRYTPSTTPQGRQILDENYQPVQFYEEVHLNNRDELIVYQDHHTGHQFGDPNGVGDQPPHVHVRPYDDPRNGQIPGCEEHYYYDPSLG
ncbi:RHS repeat-associated core domain-containing protein [Streptomyces sp. DSM 44917]|uniref:RHS repeat-associated core domain-containing protein n=1 Tax=Streptomyces boetiae TaxID=3075541 RepID=A0ABU2LDC3_9ACTN|nr:DUF6531 domain-containing protein [Streptomyces sp. DSM 44917]MDT0309576.1 RHS repeat-associated core domain-containing protein [Streptomyces sp. DSM 44917]